MEKKQCYLDKSAHPPGGGAHQSLIEIALYFKIALNVSSSEIFILQQQKHILLTHAWKYNI